MKEFITKLMENEKMSLIDFKYSDYDTCFAKGKFNTYYLFFFLEEEQQLLELRGQSSELYSAIKKNKSCYEENMDKNTTCIYCLCVDDAAYYETESTGTISDLSKKICLVEEDLNYFKKNVLLYTSDMKQYANDNVGLFDSLCNEMITEEKFQEFRQSTKSNYQYDFLVNLFIKLPFLNFQKYQTKNQTQYQSLKSLIQKECESRNIDLNEIEEDMDYLENTWLVDLEKKLRGEN